MPDTADAIEITNAGVAKITKLSEEKIEANRRNARLSTGPRTEAGKNRSRHNAIKHGIFSRDVLQSEGFGKEDTKEFADLLTGLLEDCKPIGVQEEILVQRIALCLWRLKRSSQYEVGTMMLRYRRVQTDLKSRGESDSFIEFLAPRLLHLRLPESKKMDLLLRYETTFHRQLISNLNQLERLQRKRGGEHVPAPLTVQVMTG
jgi:hypothetical protein